MFSLERTDIAKAKQTFSRMNVAEMGSFWGNRLSYVLEPEPV